MIILLAAVLITAFGIWLCTLWDWEGVGICLILFGGLFLLGWPLSYGSDLSAIQGFEAVKRTTEAGREAGYPLEGAAFQAQIAEANSWLLRAQYWNDTALFDWYIPDAVENLEPIE